MESRHHIPNVLGMLLHLPLLLMFHLSERMEEGLCPRPDVSLPIANFSRFLRGGNRNSGWDGNNGLAVKIYLITWYLVKTAWVYTIMLLYMTFNGYVIFAATFGLTLGYALNDMRTEWNTIVDSDGHDCKDTTCCWHEEYDFDA